MPTAAEAQQAGWQGEEAAGRRAEEKDLNSEGRTAVSSEMAGAIATSESRVVS